MLFSPFIMSTLSWSAMISIGIYLWPTFASNPSVIGDISFFGATFLASLCVFAAVLVLSSQIYLRNSDTPIGESDASPIGRFLGLAFCSSIVACLWAISALMMVTSLAVQGKFLSDDASPLWFLLIVVLMIVWHILIVTIMIFKYYSIAGMLGSLLIFGLILSYPSQLGGVGLRLFGLALGWEEGPPFLCLQISVTRTPICPHQYTSRAVLFSGLARKSLFSCRWMVKRRSRDAILTHGRRSRSMANQFFASCYYQQSRRFSYI
jgi:hypothetical protein